MERPQPVVVAVDQLTELVVAYRAETVEQVLLLLEYLQQMHLQL